MYIDLVQFANIQNIEKCALLFREDSIIVAKDFTVKELESFPAAKNSSQVKILSCKVFSKKDSSALQLFKKLSDCTAVAGTSIDLCSWAANTKGIDLLLQPFSPEKCFLDLQTANVLRDNDIFVCLLFNEFLESGGFSLAQLLKNAAMCAKVCNSAGTKMLFLSGAKNEFQMRASKDLSSFACLLGVKKEDALAAVRGNAKEFMGRLK